MTDTVPAIEERESMDARRACLCESFARVTERAALAGARWLGRDDEEGAEREATAAMKAELAQLPIDAHVVVGAGDNDESLHLGDRIGAGGAQVDLALDPLEG